MKALPDNQVTLLRNGAEFFPALVEAIDAASEEVWLETYIFAEDEIGKAVAGSLARAAGRGARVRLLLDGFGSRELSEAFVRSLREAGVSVQFFRPHRGWLSVRRSRFRRLHRKIALVDGRVAFVGGINIIDDHSGHDTGEPRYDYAVRVEGPLVDEITPVVHRLWWLVAALAGHPRRPGFQQPLVRANAAGGVRAAFVHRDNFRHRHAIEHLYLEGIRSAEHEIVIACAYFMPGLRMRQALVAAARRGVRVAIVVQGWSDHRVFQQASRLLYGALLDAGVEIHEYVRSELHAKAAVVDGRWATVGSSNLDPFSLMLAREANVAVFDEAFGQGLRASILSEMRAGARQVPPTAWRRRSLLSRLVGWLAYGYARLAMGVAGIAQDWS